MRTTQHCDKSCEEIVMHCPKGKRVSERQSADERGSTMGMIMDTGDQDIIDDPPGHNTSLFRSRYSSINHPVCSLGKQLQTITSISRGSKCEGRLSIFSLFQYRSLSPTDSHSVCTCESVSASTHDNSRQCKPLQITSSSPPFASKERYEKENKYEQAETVSKLHL